MQSAMPKKKISESRQESGELSEQEPMSGAPAKKEQPLATYPRKKHDDDVALLVRRAFSRTGDGVKNYVGYLENEDGARIALCEYYQLKDGKMVVMKGRVRNKSGELTPPGDPQHIDAYELTIVESMEEGSVVFPTLIVNVRAVRRAKEIRSELFRDAGERDFSLSETMRRLYDESKDMMSPDFPDRKLFELK